MESNTSKIQKVCKQILKEFNRICEKYDLTYYLIDGSLLGAIRHNGFIPWDDDMDIAMPREDYEKFCEIVNKELPDNMYWVSYEESLKGNSLSEIAQLYCKDLTLKFDYFSKSVTTNVWMDVMIIYGMPSNKFKRWLHYKHYYLVKSLARMGRIQNVGGKKYNFIERTGIFLAQHVNLSTVFDTEKMLLKSVSILKKYPYNASKYLIVVPSEYGKNEIVPKDYYYPSCKHAFEDLTCNVPNKSELILTQLYGDYLKYPPESERKSKHKVEIMN